MNTCCHAAFRTSTRIYFFLRYLLDESDIDAIILKRDQTFPEQVQNIIHTMITASIENLVGMLRECGIDLRIGQTVFAGGGSMMLKQYINVCKKIGSHIFIEDISVNVKGYELMFRMK